MNLIKLCRRVPFWVSPVLFVLALGLIYAAFLVGIGGRFYIGDMLLLTGLIVYVVATYILARHIVAAVMGSLGLEE